MNKPPLLRAYMHPFQILPCDGHGVTADKLYRPRALMTRAMAEEMLRIAAKYPKGTIREEFMEEARRVINDNC